MKLTIGIFLASTLLAQQPLSFEAHHKHWHGECSGRLTFDDEGVQFDGTGSKGHTIHWDWLDIQQLKIQDDGAVSLLTYKDNRWRLGADRELHFSVTDPRFAERVASLAGRRLDRRFIASFSNPLPQPLWDLPVKHLLRITGSEGTLAVYEDRIIYKTGKPGDTRTWYLRDIEGISASGDDGLTITTYERARSHYGHRKDFNFELKQPLSEARYNELWRRLEQAKGLEVLSSAAGHAPVR